MLPLRPDDHNCQVIEEADTDPALLSILDTFVQVSEERSVEHGWHVRKVDLVQPDIDLVLLVIPFELHRFLVLLLTD